MSFKNNYFLVLGILILILLLLLVFVSATIELLFETEAVVVFRQLAFAF